ncbi:fatty acid desaturase [Pseudoroseomonas globiformis]|uniref:Fatty acid desaturase n=1 Tax=Teichococcus globiformis TaxID=2307229 RepID=A0ABV7G1J9_9PROT
MQSTAAQWSQRLAPYMGADHRRSIGQLVLSLTLFVASVTAGHVAHAFYGMASLPFSFLAGLLIVRLFVIQHDCGHRSFFRNTTACDWTGRVLSLFTLTPYGYWRRDHNKHHATSGDLDRRGSGDVDTLTVREYNGSGWRAKLQYRLYRHPVVLLGFGPAWQFLLRYRLPIGLGKVQRGRMVGSILLHNAALMAFFCGLAWFLGPVAVATVWLPAVMAASTVGVWLFYVQHQFEGTYWERHMEWSFVDAALSGCSYYRLPRWMHWLTGNIGYHHIHHLSSRIPNYRLASVFAEVPELREAPSIGLIESLRCAQLALWCEDRRRLVSFRDARASQA